MSALKKVYDMLPVALQNICVSLYGIKRQYSRYGGDFKKRLAFFLETEKKDKEFIEEYQLNELIKLLKIAEKSEHYKKAFEEAGVKPEDIKTLSDIKKLPVLSKQDLRKNVKSFYTYYGNRNLTFHTSGSTGTPLTIKTNIEDFRSRMALLERLKICHGVNRKMRHITFVGKVITKKKKCFWRYNLFGRQLVMSVYDLHDKNKDLYLKEAVRYKPEVIEGYPSAVNILAKWAIEEGTDISPKAVFVTAETLLPEQRENIEKAFGCKVINYYGSAEGAPLITQCEQGRLHVNFESGIVEFLRDDGTDAAPCEPTHMVVTCFLTKSTPLIRYKIEDMAVYSDTKCECGRSSIVVDEILGRLDDVLITPEKGAVGRLSTSFKLLPPVIRRAQIRQMAPDRFDLLLEADSGDIQPGLIDPVLSDLEDKLGKVNITVKYVKEIPAGANGKFRSQIKCF